MLKLLVAAESIQSEDEEKFDQDLEGFQEIIK